jgi:hypothetical protein
MANELFVSRPGSGLTLYAIIRRLPAFSAFDTVAGEFVTWNDANIGDYDIPLTDAGGDVHKGDMPAGIAAGTRLLILYYQQAGGAPATSDALLLSLECTYNGSSLVSASEIALSDCALTSLESAKRFMGITTSANDTLLTELINAVSARVEREVGRKLCAADHNEWVNPQGEREFTVRHWPVSRARRVRYGRSDGLEIQYAGSAIEAFAAVAYDNEGSGNDGVLTLTSISAAGVETETELTFATYPTLSTLVTAINAVTGWTAYRRAVRDGQSLALSPVAGVDALNMAAYLPYAEEFDMLAVVDQAAGILRTKGCLPGPLLVSYRGGFDPIPDDLALIVNQLVQLTFNSASSDSSLQSESIPGYSYSRASRAEITASQREILRPYMSSFFG